MYYSSNSEALVWPHCWLEAFILQPALADGDSELGLSEGLDVALNLERYRR